MTAKYGGALQSIQGLRWVHIISLSVFLFCTTSFGLTPLKVSSNGRYLTDQSGKPFLIHGDTPWGLFSNITQSDAKYYLDNRKAKKFNTIHVNLLTGALNTPNVYGQRPFSAKLSGQSYWDLTTPNPKYFATCDSMINAAAARGIYVFIVVCWIGGYGEESDWYKSVLANGTTRCRTYGQWIGNRYKNFPNVVWIMEGDKNPSDEKDEVRAMALGIRDFDKNHLLTAHCKRHSSARDWFNGESWLTLNSAYTDSADVVSEALIDYNRTSPVMPSYLIEAYYEGEHTMTSIKLRRQVYWALFCGLAGQVIGNNPLYFFGSGWKTALNSTHSKEQVHVKSLMDSRYWYMMVPDQNRSVVTTGGGSYPNIIRAMRATDGRTVMVYLPGGQKPTVVMSKVSGGKAKCWWYNPRTGAATLISTYTASGTRTFYPPDASDWVLVLDDATKGYAAPGTSSLAREMAEQEVTVLANNEMQTPILFQSLSAEPAQVLIYSASGRIVKNHSGNVTSVADIHALLGPGTARGMYYYTISGEKGVVRKGKLTYAK